MNLPRGSITPLVTPFRDGLVDVKALERLADFQITHGSHGIGVTGTTGEPTSLTMEERELVIATAVQAAHGRVPVLAGTGSVNFQETRRLTQYAREAGAAAALLIVPYYCRPTQAGLYEHFRQVAESVPSYPLMLYNIPGRSAVNLEPATMARLRRACPNILGVKEANTDFAQISRVLSACGRDFGVYSGIESLCFPMLALGGAGHVSATGNLLPKEVADLYNLCEEGRWNEARDLHFWLLEINEALFIETNPGPVKAALGMMGLMSPEMRLPMAPVSAATEDRLRTVMATYGLLPTDKG
ncbi:MAG TPA: 2,4-dihydroxyhept-2-ene-1,7-dioic acid aldolase [Chloroflexota bacterium]|nr:2,4-dihydroxyhept-2-ene-1,7-dioic acid aldolase [Chloroflexota bacterium]